jgi:hypothetical protein
MSELLLQGISYRNFIDAIHSPQTKIGYNNALKRYMNHFKMTDVDNLLLNSNSKAIEAQIIDYIMSLRQDGISYSTIRFLIAPIFTFYQLNDVVLNRKKVSRYMGEFKRVDSMFSLLYLKFESLSLSSLILMFV